MGNNTKCGLHVKQPDGYGFYFIGFFKSVKEAKKHAKSISDPDAGSYTEFLIITDWERITYLA